MRPDEGSFMTKTLRLAAVLTTVLCVVPTGVRAGDDDGAGRRIWNGVGATAMNVLPVVSVRASQRCLPGYILCKLSFAGMGLAASGAQIFFGGDVAGARRTAGRALGGDWVVMPRHLETGIKPDPYPEAPSDDTDADLPDL
jgi:hypothetical protein